MQKGFNPEQRMGLLTCGCLNVKIHVKNTDLKQLDPVTLDNIDPNEEFFMQKISTAHLNLEGVIVEHWSLVKKKVVRLWTLHKCINCRLWTHALRQEKGTSLVLVNMALRSRETIITGLSKSTDFSPLYKVVLPDRTDNRPIQTVGVQSEKYESLQQVLTTIQQQLNKFLVNEENAMEERIKQFEQSQRSGFAALQKKARQDKNMMIRMILNAEGDKEGNNEDEDQVDFSSIRSNIGFDRGLDNNRIVMTPSQPVQSVPAGKTANLFGVTAGNQNPIHSNTNISREPPTKTSRTYSKSSSALSSRLMGENGNNNPLLNKDNDGPLFDMDSGFDPTFGDEEVARPFYNSDDEENEEDTDDSELDSPAAISSAAMYSTSVPISVPAWKMARKSKHKELDEEDESPPDPDNIAASIKALAKSVHGDGKEIFGDLPRGPRPNNVYSSHHYGGGGFSPNM